MFPLKVFNFICLITVLCCCNTNSNSPKIFELQYPSHFPIPIASPQRNQLTYEGIALGKKLFFDPALSADGQISCATCHQPRKSFSDSQKFSTGHSGKSLKRNTPALINLAWQENFFWDGGVKNLESLSFAALMNKDEMGADLAELCNKLNNDLEYKQEFKSVFKIDSISSAYISRALAQYMRTIVSVNSKYDSVQQNQASFSPIEEKGKIVFEKNCKACHIPPLFMDNGFHHNGIQQIYTSENLHLSTGLFRITRDSADLGKYKTPSLRSLNLTAPYMHDGRFSSIDQVLNHYQNIDQTNQGQDSIVSLISFTAEDKLALLAFLRTLNGNKEMNFK